MKAHKNIAALNQIVMKGRSHGTVFLAILFFYPREFGSER